MTSDTPSSIDNTKPELDEVPGLDEAPDVTLPDQEQVYRAPARFGHVPVAREPLGWDPRNRGFRNHYPNVRLPTQVVDRVSLGAPDLDANRLIWGDNLHVMRTLPSESVDLIYIDPPFFSNRVYNVIWGDELEERSFSDIWEGGLDGYLIWLNARLYEMKRLLKPAGSIYVHCDWHASHYIKVEMDKLFGYEHFRNEVIWSYRTGGSSKSSFAKKHDVILSYSRSNRPTFVQQKEKAYTKSKSRKPGVHNYGAGTAEFFQDEGGVYNFVNMRDVWEIPYINSQAQERVGYPTQKPETLIERIIKASSHEGDVVLDAFVGGGTTAVVAQRLGRRWIAMDQ